jgi:glutaredoxin
LGITDTVLAVLGRRRSRGHHEVMLYGKPGCHLCDDARAMLDRLSERYSFTVQEVDITSDPALFRRYDIRIPVLVIDGGEEVDAPLREEVVRRLLR